MFGLPLQLSGPRLPPNTATGLGGSTRPAAAWRKTNAFQRIGGVRRGAASLRPRRRGFTLTAANARRAEHAFAPAAPAAATPAFGFGGQVRLSESKWYV